MNWLQIKRLCGVGSRIEVSLNSGDRINGKLIGIGQDELLFESDVGTVRPLRDVEIAQVQMVSGADFFDDPEIKEAALRVRKRGNELTNPYPFDFKAAFANMIEETVQELKEQGQPGTEELIAVLGKQEQLRTKALSADVAERCVQMARNCLQEADRRRGICFVLWYAAGETDKAMKVLTDELTAREQGTVDELYFHLAVASYLLGRQDALMLFWLRKYFSEVPERALADNELCCSPAWLAYLDMSSDMMYFEGIHGILEKLDENLVQGYPCVYNSLCRMFGRGGRHGLAREAVSALCGYSYQPRDARELAAYLRSDVDGHCSFVALAAEKIMQEGIVSYQYTGSELRCGYLYDYTDTKHHNRILGYDLMTYFLPTSAVTDARRKEIKRSFDLSQYADRRTLMGELSFYVEKSFRRGDNYRVKTLL